MLNSTPSAWLSVENLHKSFGGVLALSGVSFQVYEKEIFGLIGPNGAGKTTLFNVISGLHAADQGHALLRNQRLTGLSPYRVAAAGVARTFQNLQIFHSLTVLENVLVGCHRHGTSGLLSSLLHLPDLRREERNLRERAFAALDFCDLADYAQLEAHSLPPGQQRLLEIARALAMEPRLLLLDEPAAGLTTRETETLSALIDRLGQTGLTTLVIEHDMNLVMGICARVAVLDQGSLLAVGEPTSIQANPAVIAAYLGEEGAA